MCVIHPEEFSSRFYILLGAALSKATLSNYKKYIKRYCHLSALEKTLNMLRLFGLDYTLERQGVTVKKHHLARLESRYAYVKYVILITQNANIGAHNCLNLSH